MHPPSASPQANGEQQEQGSLTMSPGCTGESGPSGSSGPLAPAAVARSSPYNAPDRPMGSALQSHPINTDSESSSTGRRFPSKRLKLELRIANQRADLVKRQAAAAEAELEASQLALRAHDAEEQVEANTNSDRSRTTRKERSKVSAVLSSYATPPTNSHATPHAH